MNVGERMSIGSRGVEEGGLPSDHDVGVIAQMSLDLNRERE
jgi:hypothetical protein